jgi:hypothetical protein
MIQFMSVDITFIPRLYYNWAGRTYTDNMLTSYTYFSSKRKEVKMSIIGGWRKGQDHVATTYHHPSLTYHQKSHSMMKPLLFYIPSHKNSLPKCNPMSSLWRGGKKSEILDIHM